MKIKQIAGMLLISVGFTACMAPTRNANSGSGGNGHNPCSLQLHTVTDQNSGAVTTYTYDGQNRVKTISSPSGTTKYQYTGSTSVTQMPPTGPAITYTLDSNGDIASDSRGVTYTIVNGFRTLASYPAGSVGGNPQFTVTDSYDAANNVITETRTGWHDSTFTYTYNTSFLFYDDGQAYMGKFKVNWPATMVETDGTKLTYDYTADSCGRVSTQKVTVTAPDGTVSSVNTYTYTYN